MKIMLRGNAKEFEAPMTALEIAASISHELKKEAVAAKIDGEVKDLKTVIDHDCEVEFLTFADEEGRRVYRHTASHVLAQAVKALLSGCQAGHRPGHRRTASTMTLICAEPFTTDDLARRSKRKCSASSRRTTRSSASTLPRAEAHRTDARPRRALQGRADRRSARGRGDLLLSTGRFHRPVRGPAPAVHRLCQGGQAHSRRRRLLARRREEQDAPAASTAPRSPTRRMLEEYLQPHGGGQEARPPQARPRAGSVRHPGRGPRLPVLLPQGHGAAQHAGATTGARFTARRGYEEIKTPIILNRDLWERSGHWDHYKENMYTTVIDDDGFRHQAHELPRRHSGLQAQAALATATCPSASASWAWCTAMSCPARCTA